MRIVHWFFLVSVALFVSGIAFVVAAERAARRAPAVDTANVSVTPVATVKQIMNGIVGPAATVVFEAVSISVTRQGTETKAPQSDKEWEAVGNSAAALIESGNLMLIGTRAVDKGDWVKQSQALIASAKVALKAVQDRNAEQLLSSGEAINAACDACHAQYKRGD